MPEPSLQPFAAPDLPPSEILSSAQSILLAQLCRQQGALAVINLVVALIFAASAGFYASPILVAVWFGYCLIVQALRVAWVRPWLRGNRSPVADRHGLAWRLTASSLLAGVVWGAMGWFFSGTDAVILNALVLFVLAGMAGGSITALPAHPPAFIAFLAAAVLPMALCLGLDPRPNTDIMALLTVLYALGIGFLGRQSYRTQLDNAGLSLAKEQLVASLREAGLDLEERVDLRTRELRIANEQMAKEIETRHRSEAQVRHLLHHDPLTNLPNRLVFADRLEIAIRRASRNASVVALVLFDVDRFKSINDTFGHLTGDAVLRAMAARLARVFRASDTLARMGGDEFAAIFPDLKTREDVDRVAVKIARQMQEPLVIEGRPIAITLSIGIALFPEHGRETSALFSGADLALYHAKLEGRGRFRFLSAEMLHHERAQRQVEDELKGAVDRGEFHLVYQPQMSLRRNCVIGAEALVRWNHPRQGLLLPGAFIPAAEASGLVREIDNWVLATACRQAVLWQRQGHPVRVAVNLSPLEFRHPGLADRIARHLARTRLDPMLLEIEITESAYLDRESASVEQQLHEIKRLGARIAIDDFGTGYASLSYLRWLPVDVVKIDRSFVSNIGDTRHDEAIVASTISLVTTLGKSVIAEGVETATQCETLRRLGCDEMQGYLFGRPASEHQILERLVA